VKFAAFSGQPFCGLFSHKGLLLTAYRVKLFFRAVSSAGRAVDS
jgi:hypothetical protein